MNIRISESEDQLFIQSAPLDSTRTFTQRTVSRSEIIIRTEIRNNNFGVEVELFLSILALSHLLLFD